MRRSSLQTNIVPRDMAHEEVFGDAREPLFRVEKLHIAHATKTRKREFETVRACARNALLKFGMERGPLVATRSGLPWPDGIVGSMTHCCGYRAAVIGESSVYSGIGIDAEPNLALPVGVFARVFSLGEKTAIHSLSREDPFIAWDRLLFSVKESVYKAQAPLSSAQLGFRDVEITLNGYEIGVQIHIGQKQPPVDWWKMRGQWTMHRGILFSAVWVPAQHVSGKL